MSHEPKRYLRREFLAQCAAMPVAMKLSTGGGLDGLAAEEPPGGPFEVRPIPEADLAREVESLLKLVDPQLQHRHVPLADDKNGWPLWERASKALVQEPFDEEFQEGLEAFLNFGPALPEKVRQRILQWIADNEEARRLTDEGIARGAIEMPRATKSIRLAFTMDDSILARKLAQAKQAYAYACLHRQDVARAIEEARSILKMGVMLRSAECLMVEYLVAQATLGTGKTVLYHAATSSGASDEQMATAIEALAATRTTVEHLKRAHRIEFCRWFLPIIASFPANANHGALAHQYVVTYLPDIKPTRRQADEYQRCKVAVAMLLDGHPEPFDKESTVRLASQLHVRFFGELDKPWLRRDRNVYDAATKQLVAWPKGVEPDIFAIVGGQDNPNAPRKPTDAELEVAREALRAVENLLGKRLIVDRSPILAPDLFEIQGARWEAARIRIALRAYEKHHGRLPGNLQSLVDDKLLLEVPRDPYANGPFPYSPERRVIWSVGRDGKNEGIILDPKDGDTPFDEDFELTWRIPPL